MRGFLTQLPSACTLMTSLLSRVSANVTWQRELPGNMLLEVGYVGRFANELTQSMSFGQVPYNFLDKTSSQTFAQAFGVRQIAVVSDGDRAARVVDRKWLRIAQERTPGS